MDDVPFIPIVARFRPRNKTRPKKTWPKAKWAIGRVFMSYGRVLKTRPQNRFFVVYSAKSVRWYILSS